MCNTTHLGTLKAIYATSQEHDTYQYKMLIDCAAALLGPSGREMSSAISFMCCVHWFRSWCFVAPLKSCAQLVGRSRRRLITIWGMVALAGLWHDRSRASAGYVVSVCQDAFPSEARILWNGGAQCGGQSHWHRDWHVIALQSAWRNLHPRTPNYERWKCGHDHTLPLNFSICYTKL